MKKGYYIKRFQKTKNVKIIGFYDTVSFSFMFGFWIRKYPSGKVLVRVIPQSWVMKEFIPTESYKSCIKALKSYSPQLFTPNTEPLELKVVRIVFRKSCNIEPTKDDLKLIKEYISNNNSELINSLLQKLFLKVCDKIKIELY